MGTQIIKGTTYLRVVEPGNATRYFIVAGVTEAGEPYVALPDFRVAAILQWQWHVHPSYAAEKLDLAEGDAVAVADALNALASEVVLSV